MSEDTILLGLCVDCGGRIFVETVSAGSYYTKPRTYHETSIAAVVIGTARHPVLIDSGGDKSYPPCHRAPHRVAAAAK